MEANNFYKANKNIIKEKIKKNSIINSEGRVVIGKNDEWRTETEWDFLYEKLERERSFD